MCVMANAVIPGLETRESLGLAGQLNLFGVF